MKQLLIPISEEGAFQAEETSTPSSKAEACLLY